MTLHEAKQVAKRIDERYSINYEYIGDTQKKFVLRFCGDFICSNKTLKDAILELIFHDDDRNFKLLN